MRSLSKDFAKLALAIRTPDIVHPRLQGGVELLSTVVAPEPPASGLESVVILLHAYKHIDNQVDHLKNFPVVNPEYENFKSNTGIRRSWNLCH